MFCGSKWLVFHHYVISNLLTLTPIHILCKTGLTHLDSVDWIQHFLTKFVERA